MPRGTRRKETDAANSGSRLADVTAAWSRLDELQRTMFIAAVLRDAMTKPASQAELMLWISVCRIGRRQRSLNFLQ